MDDAEQRSSSLRAEPAPSLSLSARRERKISLDSRSVDWWLAQMEMWELGHPDPKEPKDSLRGVILPKAVAMARQLQLDKPPLPKRKWLLRVLMFDPLLIEHPLCERLIWSLSDNGKVRFIPPTVPDWWIRTRSPKEIEEFRDRCRVWRELLALRLLRQDSASHPSKISLDPRYLRKTHPPSSHPGATLLPFDAQAGSRKTKST